MTNTFETREGKLIPLKKILVKALRKIDIFKKDKKIIKLIKNK